MKTEASGQRVLKNIFIIAVFYSIVNFFLLSFDVLLYKWDLDFSESFFLYPFLNLKNYGEPYSLDFHNMMNAAKYTPLYYVVAYPFLELAGFSVFSLRIASFISLIFILFLIAKYIFTHQKLKNDRILVLCLAFYFLITPVSFWLNVQGRLEWIGMTFVILSVFSFIRYIHDNGILYLKISIIFSLLAFLVKQTFISLPLSIIFYTLLFRKKDVKNMLFSFMLYSLLLTGFYSLLYKDFVLTMLLPGIYSPSFDVIKMIFFESMPFLIIFFILRERITLKRETSFLFFYAMISLLISILFNLRSGGWIYYSLEFFVASSLLLSCVYNSLSRQQKVLLLTMLLFLIQYYAAFDPRISFYVFDRYSFPPLVNLKTDMAIQSIVNKFGDRCITENPSYMVNIGIMPPESWLAYELYRNGYVDENDIYNAFFKNKDCIIYYDRFSHLPGFEKLSSDFYLYKRLTWVDLAFHKRDVFILFRKSIKYG